jgi:superfamily II DNA or RNA helicase
MNLYDYQQKVIDDVEAQIAAGIKRVLIAAPTGSGKTVIAGEITRRAVAQSKRVVFIAHRDELLTQARRSLARFGIQAGIIKSGRDNDQRVISQLEARMNTDVLVGDVVEHWLRHAERRRTVVFAVDIAHSVHICRELQTSGIKAEHLDGNTPQDERDSILARLVSGETEVVCNCAVLTEGFDLPALGCIVLVRPTKSLLLFLQMIGRGLRAAPPDKKNCIILDHAGACNRHGGPDDPIIWTLDKDERAANKAHEARKSEHKEPFCECPQCGEMRLRGFGCDACGWEPKPRGQGIDYIDDNLIELGNTERQHIDQLAFYRQLRGYAANKLTKSGAPYSPKWAAHKFKEKFGHFPPWAWNDHSGIEPSDATLRWVRSRQIAYAKARAADGSVSVEAGLMAMLTRMQMGKLKVFKHLNDWWEEFRLYHRKDGKVVKEGDDLLAATRYGIMMLRFGSTKATKFRGPIEYPKVKYV